MKVPIQTGQTLQMLLPVGERTIQCYATVIDVGVKTFDTALPQRHGVRIPVEVDQITVTLTMPDAIYTMRCPVLVVNSEGMSLAVPEDIQRVQRRQYVRVPSELPCVVEPAIRSPEDPDLILDFGPAIPGKLQDISGGGCSFVITPELSRDDFVRITLHIPNEGEVLLYGKVMRCRPQQTRNGSQFSLGVDFGKMDEGLRSMIIRFVFAIQREMARKEKMPRGPQ